VTVTWDQIRGWRSAPLEAAAQQLHAAQTQLIDLGQDLRGADPGFWMGVAAAGARAELTLITEELEDRVTEIGAARRGLLEAADAVTGVERLTGDAERFAAARQLQITGLQVHDLAEPLCFQTQHDADVATAERQRLVYECVAMVDQALRKATEVDADLCRVLQNGILSGLLAREDAATLSQAAAAGYGFAQDGLYAPPAGKGTAAQNAAWWNSLSDSEQRQTIAQHPEWIANRDGVSFAARDQANRILLPRYQAALEQELADLEARRRYALDHNHPKNRAVGLLNDQISLVEDKLASIDTVSYLATQPGRRILNLDLTHDRAQAVVSVGDVDTADHIAVFTPGLTSTVQGMDGYDDNMRQLRLRTLDDLNRHHSAETVATVTWIGYQAPQLATIVSSNSVGLDNAATTGGHDLAEFYRGINAARITEPDLTALGHSYGSTTTGFALQEHSGVDRAAFFGSPGLSVDNTDGLQVPSDAASYAEATWDGVGDLRRFGHDPSTMPGMNQLETGAATDPDGRPLAAVAGHTSYLNDQTTSQYNLAAVVAGHPEDVITGTTDPYAPPKNWWAPWNA
jgi:Alpha/beta hydrolase